MLRVDLHIHTRFSKDSAAPIESVIERCRDSGLGPVAITDHDNIRGALEVQRVAPFPVIIGEEIKSASGDIIGLFLKEEVPPGLLPVETARRVKDQGGLVVVPHPFCRLRPTTLKRRALEEILPLVDLIEGFNSHTVFYGDNSKGAEFARQHSVPIVASSDSHSALELGNTFTEINENDYDGTPEGLLRAVASGHLDRKRPNPLLLMAPGYAKLRKMLA